MAKKQTPQQKKEKSLERDRRNAHGENSKSSRKAIPLRKKRVNRLNRRADAQRLQQPAESPDDLAEVENAVKGRRPKQWKKSADIPLKDHLKRQAVFRSRREGRKSAR